MKDNLIHLENYMRFLIEDNRLYPTIVLTEADTPYEIVGKIKKTKKETNDKIEDIKKKLRDDISKYDAMVTAGSITNYLAAEKKEKLKKKAIERIKVLSRNNSSKLKKLNAKLAKATNQKLLNAFKKKGKAKTIGKTLVKVAGPHGGTLLALSIAVASYAYNETMADAGKYCDHLKGYKKDECLTAFRNKARIRKINILTREAGIKCKNAADPANCRKLYRTKINKIRKKIK